MQASVEIASSYTGETVGDRFADQGMAEARSDVGQMIEEAGLQGKIVALIIPNELHANARVLLNAHGRQLVTLWGRTPESDLPAVTDLIAAAKDKHGAIFHADSGGRVGPDGDIIIAPYTMHSTAPVPPKTWN